MSRRYDPPFPDRVQAALALAEYHAFNALADGSEVEDAYGDVWRKKSEWWCPVAPVSQGHGTANRLAARNLGELRARWGPLWPRSHDHRVAINKARTDVLRDFLVLLAPAASTGQDTTNE